jgi:hypothetical protein
MITPENFNQDKYKRSGWTAKLYRTSWGEIRLIVHVATGRKYWCLFTLVPNFELGENDPMLDEIEQNLKYYTFPAIDRFVDELQIMLSDLYQKDIKLSLKYR